MNTPIKLYIKSGCPWCDEAIEWLDGHGFKYEVVDVRRDAAAMEEMVELTGQTKAPCMDANGLVLADFGADELAVFVEKHGLRP